MSALKKPWAKHFEISIFHMVFYPQKGILFNFSWKFFFEPVMLRDRCELPENLKKSKPKKIVISNKSIFIFCDFKNGQKSIFELGKSLKLTKMQFHVKTFLIDLISRGFFCLDFFKFSSLLCVIENAC